MCGIAGFFTTDPRHGYDMGETCRTMTSELIHRGPDSEGQWIDTASGVALGHRRLSILDLTPSGHQPMASRCGRFMIVFNGEIYNHIDLRRRLSGQRIDWRGHSDTETLIEAIATWGLATTLKRSLGMFSMAVWDRQTSTLSLARDRFGEKPLYYLAKDALVLFASELRAMECHPAFQAHISLDALARYFDKGYIPGPLSIYEDVYKLPPGSVVSFNAASGWRGTPEAYWEITEASRHKEAPSNDDAVSAIEPVFRDAVARQMISDVPIGAFLSGGIDSSLVVAQMQELSSRPINTFTIGFEQAAYDEAEQARRVATHLGTNHTEVRVTDQHLLALAPNVANVYDEPFADASQIPTILLCQLARQHVTVALSGDGADELFGGYRRYTDGPALLRLTRPIPSIARKAIARGITSIPPAILNGLPTRLSDLSEKANKVGAMLSMDSVDALHAHLTTHPWPYGSPVRGALSDLDLAKRPLSGATDDASIRHMMQLDIQSYLPDDILVKVDRAAMASSLETRAPFLDPLVAQAAWRLPESALINRRRGKMVLRHMLEKRLPDSLLSSSKRGFTPPLGTWLKGPLRPWAENLLDPLKLKAQGILDTQVVQRMWREHQSGSRSWTYQLWDILMFQAWLDKPDRRTKPSLR